MQRSNLRTLRQKELGGTNMDNIYSLLELNADLLSNFPIQANVIEDKGTERILNQNYCCPIKVLETEKIRTDSICRSQSFLVI